jgi:glucose uptake protein
MFSIHNQTIAVSLCVLTMLGWGSWANTLKFSSQRKWPFELFYWDYALGMVATCFAVALSLGSHGSTGMDALSSLTHASRSALWAAFLAGQLFNLSNILIVIATDLAGIAIAFPVAVGLAVVIGTSVTYLQSPSGHVLPLFSGLALLVVAMILSGVASHLQTGAKRQRSMKGVLFAVLSGCIMGFFYPRLAASMGSGSEMTRGYLTPYAAALVFVLSLLVSNMILNTILLRVRGQSYARYFLGPARVHLFGLAGGAIWMVALIANLIASSIASPAISYALGQGATLVAAIWGVVLWKEFTGSSTAVTLLLGFMFLSYTCGLVLIGKAAF